MGKPVKSWELWFFFLCRVFFGECFLKEPNVKEVFLCFDHQEWLMLLETASPKLNSQFPESEFHRYVYMPIVGQSVYMCCPWDSKV